MKPATTPFDLPVGLGWEVYEHRYPAPVTIRKWVYSLDGFHTCLSIHRRAGSPNFGEQTALLRLTPPCHPAGGLTPIPRLGMLGCRCGTRTEFPENTPLGLEVEDIAGMEAWLRIRHGHDVLYSTLLATALRSHVASIIDYLAPDFKRGCNPLP